METEPAECATCTYFDTYYAQLTDSTPTHAGACLAGDRCRPANARNDACELYEPQEAAR